MSVGSAGITVASHLLFYHYGRSVILAHRDLSLEGSGSVEGLE